MTRLALALRPLTDGHAIPAEGLASTFLAPWASTVDLLRRELDYLRAARVVLELETTDAAEADLAGPAPLVGVLTGGPRVRLSFDSRHGPLSYATGRYGTAADPLAWKWNVRAIALGLQALRSVDRWGITRAGEQYSGWLRLPSGEPATSAGILLTLAGLPGLTATQVVADPGTFRRVYQAAARRHDPDAGGDVGTWARLQRARTVLLDHHGESA
jgi:hypothetical protein